MTNTRLRYVVAFFCALTLLVLATDARALDWPPFDRIAELQERADRADQLERQVARLKLQNRRLRKANRYHARWVRKLRAANRERLSFGVSGVVRGFLCVHRFEGAWNANTGNGYDGGLQMDDSFQSTYGGEFLRAIGPAWAWPPFLQVAVGMRAYYSGRGWHPWPNTARKCGLL